MSADGRPTANGTYFLRFPRRNYYGVPLLTIYGSGGAVMKESSGIPYQIKISFINRHHFQVRHWRSLSDVQYVNHYTRVIRLWSVRTRR
jgi:hypothetical protein